MSITVLNPGLLTTIQDKGRIGYQQFGVSVSGVMDPRSAAIANILVDNDENEAVLECTMMGPHLQFDEGTCIAITGGNLQPTLDGQPIAMYRAINVAAGQVLRFIAPQTGCRAFIAFSGGLDIPAVMGSKSTYMKAKIGGLDGRKLEKGDVLKLNTPNKEPKNLNIRFIAPEFLPRSVHTLRVVMGPQDDMFTSAGVETFLSETYTVTNEFDRMGCRLDGATIAHKSDANIISDGISFGAIQIPGSGTPIIMLADRQTTGGYTKIASVITADFRLLGQLKGGDKVRFQKVSMAHAHEALRAQNGAMKTLRKALNG